MTNTDHEDVRSQLGAFVLGALTPAEQAGVRAHLAVCDECAAEARALQPAADALAWSVDPVEPPPAVKQRILSSIAAMPAAKPAIVTPSRSLAPWLAAAASLALAVGLGAYASQLRGRVLTLEQELRQAILQVQAGQQLTAQARLVASDAQRQLSVLTAPDLRQVALKGQAVAPQAVAHALWSRSRGLLFAASDLPPLPPGRTYQLWVISGNMPPISDNWIFKTGASGDVTTMFATPVTLPTPTLMAVTVEPEGGRASPTLPLYLAGPLN
jgi:anti-sigma-K factor RskA